jgi:hypothetical protein
VQESTAHATTYCRFVIISVSPLTILEGRSRLHNNMPCTQTTERWTRGRPSEGRPGRPMRAGVICL